MNSTKQAIAQAKAMRNACIAWYCRDAAGVCIAVRQYRAEARHLFAAGGCADFYCPNGPVVMVEVPSHTHPSAGASMCLQPRRTK